MNFFQENSIQLADKANFAAWCFDDSQHNLLAITAFNKFLLFREEGTPFWDEKENLNKSRDAPITKIAWNPRKNILAIGRHDGTIDLWNEKANRLANRMYTDQSGHRAAVSLLQWSPEGSKLISTDLEGVLVVWEEVRGKPVLSCMIYFADDIGHCSEVVNVRTAIRSIRYSHSKDFLAIITADIVLYKYNITADGKMIQDRKVKLSVAGDGRNLQCDWVGPGLLIASNNEPLIRAWNIEQEQNYLLTAQEQLQAKNQELLTCISFDSAARVLAAGTNSGKVCLWKFVGKAGADSSETDWDPLPVISVNSPIRSLQWAPNGKNIVVITEEGKASVLHRECLVSRSVAELTFLQTARSNLTIQRKNSGKQMATTMNIKSVCASSSHAAVSGSELCEVYEIKDGNIQKLTSFEIKSPILAIYESALFAIENNTITVCNLFGKQQSPLTLTESEGAPICIDQWGPFLAAGTQHNAVKLWSLAKNEFTAILPGKPVDNICDIRAVRVNSTGTKIIILANIIDSAGVLAADSVLRVFDVESDQFFQFDFAPFHYPDNAYWDPTDDRYFVVESCHSGKAVDSSISSIALNESKEDEKSEEQSQIVGLKHSDANVSSFFITSDHGFLLQDSFPIAIAFDHVIGVDIPNIYFMSTPHTAAHVGGIVDGKSVNRIRSVSSSIATPPKIKTRPIRDFVGLHNIDSQTKSNLVQFSFFLAIGNMDEAYKAVKQIQNIAIWENMCHMCVKTKRMDVAEICLGNMGNVNGVLALKEAKKEPELEVAVACLALELGQLKEAEMLYQQCKRYDLLVKMWMAAGRWEEALQLCEQKDPIHLKTLCFQYAKHLELIGDYANAVKFYEKSNTHQTEVPRLLFRLNLMPDLQAYASNSSEQELLKWWAMYCESAGNLSEALAFYQKCNDTAGMVRMLCLQQEFKQAEDLCLHTQHEGACFHLAREYENFDRLEEALKLYSMAKRFNHCLRIAILMENDNEVYDVALQSNDKQLQFEAACHLEEKQLSDKAVLLFKRSGRVAEALDLAESAQLYDTARDIAAEIEPSSDPALLQRVGDFFVSNGQFANAAEMMANSGDIKGAIAVCIENKVNISEELTEALTPPKAKTEAEKQERVLLLKQLAELLKEQGDFNLACKKLTQAGDKVNAMKCLLRTQDTEKIIYYASVVKKAEVFILAANYLQSLDWHSHNDIWKAIIGFYMKAKAFEQLASFYDACSQIEIDEFRDYEKALSALKEALKLIAKLKDAAMREERSEELKWRIDRIEQFVAARSQVNSDPQQMIHICDALLGDPNLEAAVRVGDVFGLMIEYYYSIGAIGLQSAAQLLQQMQQRGLPLEPFIDANMLSDIRKQTGLVLNDDQIQEDIYEEIAEESDE